MHSLYSFFVGLVVSVSSIFVSHNTINQNFPVNNVFKQENAQMATSSATSDIPSGAIKNTEDQKRSSNSLSQETSKITGSKKYDNGILPLGDKKYVTTGPKKGYIYVCNVRSGGGGAQVDGPWIKGSTWNENTKVHVQGKNIWPNAAFSMKVSGDKRIITANGLPVDGITGNFPVAASDPAAQYDRNPSSVSAQTYSLTFPKNPIFASEPGCIYGEVGIMTNGVPIYDGFDAEYRDAAAHEVQDSCDGHPHNGGVYHYHSMSSCISKDKITDVIGWAYDGFPITGGYTSDDAYVTTADLDECHGVTSVINLDGKLTSSYHYVITKDFPYSVSCFKGTSYEPRGGGQGQINNTTQINSQAPSNSGQTPPQEAIQACSASSSGARCSFSMPDRTITGSCRVPPGQSVLICVPE